MTGTGKAMRSRITSFAFEPCRFAAVSVSPVPVSFSPTKAAMSPAITSVISSRLSACIWYMREMRSLCPLVVFTRVSPVFSVPR